MFEQMLNINRSLLLKIILICILLNIIKNHVIKEIPVE